ncbi:MAG: MliC family protein [Pseudomonadota bacterium]
MPRLAPFAALLAAACAAPAPQATEARLLCPGHAPAPVTFLATDPPTARLTWQDREITLTQTPAASGARYASGDRVLWTKGDEARLERPGAVLLTCRLAP